MAAEAAAADPEVSAVELVFWDTAKDKRDPGNVLGAARWLIIRRATLSVMSSPFVARAEDKESAADLINRGVVPICWRRRSIDVVRGPNRQQEIP